MEVEAKFAITGTLSPASIEELDIRPYVLRSASGADHVDTLLDTPDRRITGHMRALRVRASDSGLTLTLKGPNTGAGGIHARQEWEAPLKPPLCLDPTSWPEPIASRVVELAGDEPLAAIFHVAVERRLWDVRRGARVIGELALDSGVILAAGRREPIHELELELKGSGARLDLDALSQLLCAQLPLEPEPRSKLQRGLALLLHARWTLDGYTPLDALARHYIRQKARSMRKAEHRVLKEGDPDAIHDMRVAARRIRSVLRELEEMGAFQSREPRALRKRLREVSRRLGAVRDLDIILERIAAELQPTSVARGDPSDETIADAIAHLQEQRADAYATARRKIKRAKYTRLRDELLRFDPAPDASAGKGPCPLVRGYAGGALWSRYEALMRCESAIDLGDAVGMHQARIAAKRLRYALEMFTPALGQDVEPVRRALIEFQERFGALQDTIVALRALAEVATHNGSSPAWSQLARQLEASAAESTRQARTAWRSLVSDEIRGLLARALAAL